MIIPFMPKRKLKDRIKHRISKWRDEVLATKHDLPTRKYASFCARQKRDKFLRRVRYFSEDVLFEIRKVSSYTESLLFGAIIAIAAFMVMTYRGESLITILMPILMLVLIVIIYAQLKFQKRMVRQYVPTIQFVRISKCRLFSDRIKVLNLYGMKEKVEKMGRIRNVLIAYDIVNDSYSPVSIESASLVIKLRRGKRITVPTALSILDVEPRKTSGTEVTFRLKNDIDFTSIEWLELYLKGNCSRKIRIKPHLYVNVMIRGKVPEFISEPFAKFKKRPEIAEI